MRDWVLFRGRPVKWDVSCKISGDRVSCHIVGDDSFSLPFFFRVSHRGRETIARYDGKYFHRVFVESPSGTEVSESVISREDAERIISDAVASSLSEFRSGGGSGGSSGGV